MPVVSVIIANRNDLAMLSVTVRSVLEDLKAVPGGGEVVIVDNSEQDVWEYLQSGNAIATKYFKEEKVRLFRQDFPCLFSAREEAIRQARGKYVLCLDSHMIVGHKMIRSLVDFMNNRKEDTKLGFAHAPLSWCHQHDSAARHDRDVVKDPLGPWGLAYKDERRITWKGMPWICRKDFFLGPLGGYGVLSEHKLSWGGGDMHIGVKPWLLGFENWAVPCSPGIHIGVFPNPTTVKDYKYRLYAVSGNEPSTFGFLVSAFVLGGDWGMHRIIDTLVARFKWKINPDEYMAKARIIGARERAWLLERQIMSFEEWLDIRPWDRKVEQPNDDIHGAI